MDELHTSCQNKQTQTQFRTQYFRYTRTKTVKQNVKHSNTQTSITMSWTSNHQMYSLLCSFNSRTLRAVAFSSGGIRKCMQIVSCKNRGGPVSERHHHQTPVAICRCCHSHVCHPESYPNLIFVRHLITNSLESLYAP